MDEKDLDKKLEEFDEKVTPEYLLKLHKLNLAKRIQNGETGLFEEFKKLKELEQLVASAREAATATASSPQSASPTPGEADTSLKSGDDDDRGIPEHLLIRPRKYTMSEAARKQRRDAADSPAKSEAMKGNANAWKTGEFAKSRIRQIFRPCKSTCPQYPCELIEDGETVAGSVCLDKKEFVKNLVALQKAMQTGDLTDYKDLAALQIAGGHEVVSMLIDDIVTLGTLVKSEKWNKDGDHLGYEIKNNPSLLPLAKLLEVLNVSPAEMMITPREIKRQKTEAKKAKALSNMMSGLGLGDAPADSEAVETAEGDDRE